jgi:hypothetical protein
MVYTFYSIPKCYLTQFLSCTCSVWAGKLHWLDTFLLYTVTDQYVALLVPDSCWATVRNGNRDLSQVPDKLYHILLYTSPWSGFELTTSVVIGTDCINLDVSSKLSSSKWIYVASIRFYNHLSMEKMKLKIIMVYTFWILYFLTMYIYCVYPAMSKSSNQLPNCLK